MYIHCCSDNNHFLGFHFLALRKRSKVRHKYEEKTIEIKTQRKFIEEWSVLFFHVRLKTYCIHIYAFNRKPTDSIEAPFHTKIHNDRNFHHFLLIENCSATLACFNAPEFQYNSGVSGYFVETEYLGVQLTMIVTDR